MAGMDKDDIDWATLMDPENVRKRYEGYARQWLDDPEFRAALHKSARENRERHMQFLATERAHGLTE